MLAWVVSLAWLLVRLACRTALVLTGLAWLYRGLLVAHRACQVLSWTGLQHRLVLVSVCIFPLQILTRQQQSISETADKPTFLVSEASLQRVGEATLPSGPSSTHSSFVSEGFIIESAESFPVTSVVGGFTSSKLGNVPVHAFAGGI